MIQRLKTYQLKGVKLNLRVRTLPVVSSVVSQREGAGCNLTPSAGAFLYTFRMFSPHLHGFPPTVQTHADSVIWKLNCA